MMLIRYLSNSEKLIQGASYIIDRIGSKHEKD